MEITSEDRKLIHEMTVKYKWNKSCKTIFRVITDKHIPSRFISYKVILCGINDKGEYVGYVWGEEVHKNNGIIVLNPYININKKSYVYLTSEELKVMKNRNADNMEEK